MKIVQYLKKNFKQINAIVERELAINIRFKTQLISRFLNPLAQILILFLIFGTFFSATKDYKLGYWNANNYILFLYIAYTSQICLVFIGNYSTILIREKIWKTLQALMVAPIHRFNILLGILSSEWVLISVPFIFFIIIAYILFPITLLNLLLILLIFFCISIFFASLGLAIGVMAMSKEGMNKIANFFLKYLFWLSCITYPIAIFPEMIQVIIKFNPFFYFFDALRLIWLMDIDYDLAMQYFSVIHIVVIVVFTIIPPIGSIIFFNFFYKKFGISGY